jgi:predicted alternative tryptophan synthase beta-subunit
MLKNIIPQAFFTKEAGVTKIVTKTRAGQCGSALSFTYSVFELDIFFFYT